jgi:hypothetical protein
MLFLGVIIFGSVQFFRTKTGSNRFGSVVSDFGSVFFGLGSVRFFCFRLIKPKPNQLVFSKF